MEPTEGGSPPDAKRDPIEVTAQSFLDRVRRGERPSIDEYAATYPELAEEIRTLLPALEQLERERSVAGEATGSVHARPRAATLRGAPRQLGDYTILREVGRGGMGVVYEAVQQSLGRHVALKVLPWQAVGVSSQLERFQLEARAAAKLHHTNIVPVFGVGDCEGVHYYAMQFIDGQGLDAVIAELRRLRGSALGEASKTNAGPTIALTVARDLLGGTPEAVATAAVNPGVAEPENTRSTQPADSEFRLVTPPSSLTGRTELTGARDHRYYRQVARLALQVAEGLAYAHDQGVLHRDIKPANLLVDTRGTVWITDFGLAKAEGSDGPTRTGDVLGTLRYMAPERFEGRSDRRSDVYSLGATLYELLTLESLFGDVNRAKLLDRIQHEPPTSPRRLDRRIPRDLETIVLEALAKEPAQRYRNAEAMATDLRRFIDDRPILTRPVSTTEQVWRWCRRNPVVAGLLGLLLALLVGGTIVAGLAANHFRNLAGSEARARSRADVLARTERQANALASRRAVEAQAARVEADANAREAKAVTDFLVMDLIGAAAPGKGQGTLMTIGEALARADATIDKRFADQPLLAAAIHYQMGITYWNIGDYAKAESHFRAAADLRARHLGPDARETLQAQQRLVVAVRQLGNLPEARTLGEDVLKRQRRALGPEDPDTLTTMAEIGQLLFSYSDDRAPEYYRGLHEALNRAMGPLHESTVNALHWYALAIQYRGEFKRAEALLRQALELRIRGGGEVNKATFWTMNDLVRLLVYHGGRGDTAWREVDRFWPVMARSVNPDDQELNMMTELVVTIAAVTSNWPRVEALFLRELKALASDLGPGHIRTLYVRALLARVLAERGRPDDALAIANEILETALGREVQAGVDVVLEHATAAINRARGAGARSAEITRKLQARAAQLIESGKPNAAATPLLLAIRLGATDNRIYDDLHRIAAKLGADDRVASALVAYGRVLEQSRDLNGAIAEYREATRLNPKNSSAHFGIGRVLHERGDRTGAIAGFREALRLKPDLFSEVYPFLAQLDPDGVAALVQKPGVPAFNQNMVAWRLVTASSTAPDQRSVSLAVELARHAVKAEPRNGSFRNTLGVALYRAGDWTGALAELEEAVRLTGDDRSYSYNDFFLAMIHWRLGDHRKALAYFDRAILWMKGSAPNNPELMRFRAEAEALLDTSLPRPDFDNVLGSIPASLYVRMGLALGAAGRWSEAKFNLRRGLDGKAAAGKAAIRDAPRCHVWLCLAVLELEQGDRDAYWRRCRAMFDRFGTSTDADDLERTAKAGLLAAPASLEDVARLRSIARAAIQRAGPDNPRLLVYLLTIGLAEYRAGDASAALRSLERCLESSNNDNFMISALSIQAMALHQQGQSRAARDRLASAERRVAEGAAKLPGADWPGLLIARQLASEAATVIRLDPVFPADPFKR
jgi:serine/threonine protein kinase/Flp pilus assembly protein TadD